MVKTYKIAMVGLGSIGKRHVINIDKVLSNRGIVYSLDLIRRKTSKPLESEIEPFISNVLTEEDDIASDYDVLFITNPTHLHYETINKYFTKAKHMFIEKPVFDRTSYDICSLKSKDSVYYVACPLRYTEVIQYVKHQIDIEKVYSARVICSSYLPDWRPTLDYRETYSAHIDQGGGVSKDLIHEWDYMMYLFGKPKQIHNFRGKFSRLEINSDDLSVYIAEYGNMLAEVHLDYFGRKAIRELQLFSLDETIVIDILNSEIRFLDENKVVHFSEDRNSYYFKEMANFFDILEGKASNENDICTALATLKIAEGGYLNENIIYNMRESGL